MALTYLLLIARACLHDAACVFFSPHAPCWHPSAAGRMLDTPGRGYRALGPAEGIAPSRSVLRGDALDAGNMIACV